MFERNFLLLCQFFKMNLKKMFYFADTKGKIETKMEVPLFAVLVQLPREDKLSPTQEEHLGGSTAEAMLQKASC